MPERTPWRSSARFIARLSLLLVVATIASCHKDITVPPGYHEYAYVSNGKSNFVSVIDLLQLRNVKTDRGGRRAYRPGQSDAQRNLRC